MRRQATKGRPVKQIVNPVAVESLEARQLMSGSTYTAVGTDGNDEIVVRYSHTKSGSYLSMRVNGKSVVGQLAPAAGQIIVRGLGGNDVIRYSDTHPDGAGRPITIDGGSGDDTIILGGNEGDFRLTFVQYSSMTIIGGPGSDTLTIDASKQSGVTNNTPIIKSDQISFHDTVARQKYQEIETLNLRTGYSGYNYARVESLPAGTTLNLRANSANTKFVIGTGDLDAVKGVVNVDGVSGNDSVEINDSADTTGRTYTVTNAGIQFGNAGRVGFVNIDSALIKGTQGPGTYVVRGTGLTATTISAGKGVDEMEVGGGNYAANILRPVAFWDDTAGTGSVIINDMANINPTVSSLSGGAFSRTGLPTTMWAYAKSVRYAGGFAADDIRVTPSAGVSFVVDTNGGSDKLSLALGAGETAVRTASTRTSGSYAFAGKKAITYLDVENAQASTNLPTLSINDVSIVEGNSGAAVLNFTVTLSKAMYLPVSFKATTGGGSASGSTDYTALAATFIIPAGQTSKTVSIGILGDKLKELDENFRVTLSDAVNATLLKAIGVGTILDND